MPTAARPRREGLRNEHGLPRGEPIRKALVAAFRAQRRDVLAALPKAAPGRKDLDGADPLAGLRLPDLGPGALPMAERMTPLIRALWDASGQRFRSQMGLDPDGWEVSDPNTRRMIEQAALDFCDATNATTTRDLERAKADLRRELIAGVVDRGEALPQLAKRVNRVFDRAETWRARRIAQTEASRAVHAAQEESARQWGHVAGWEWLASSDACPRCLEVGAKARYVRLGGAFAVDPAAPPAYRDARHPPLHPHCNCTCVPVLAPEYGGPKSVPWAEAPVRPEATPEPTAPEASARPAPEPPTDPTPARAFSEPGEPVTDARKAAMDAYADGHWGDWLKGLSAPERAELADYKNSGYKAINGALRSGGTHPAVATIDRALARGKTAEDLTLYRGILRREDVGITGADFARFVGHAIPDAGYVSLSMNCEKSRDGFAGHAGVLLRVRVPKGTPAGSIDPLNKHLKEWEILAGRDSLIRLVGYHGTDPSTGTPVYDAVLERMP